MLDNVQIFLLERAWRLFLALAAAQFVLICVWSWRRTTSAKRAVWIGFATIPVLVVLSVSVSTTREQIINECHELARYVETGNAAAIMARLSDDFTAEGLDRIEFGRRLINALDRYSIDRPNLARFEVTLTGTQEAAAEFDARCFVRSEPGFANRLLTRWLVLFREKQGEWVVTQLELVPTPFSPFRDLLTWFD